MELLRRVGADFPDVPVILITAHGSVDSAVGALKAGAFDYITKPFEQEELKKVIAKAARAHDLERQNVHASFGDGDRPPLVGESPAHARHLRHGGARRRLALDRPHHRRERHRQGAHREGAPPRLVPPRQAAHQGELRGDPEGPRRERAVRLRARRVHRRGRLEARPLRARRRRHAVPRRDRRGAARDAGEAPARAPGAGVRARRRHQDDPRGRAAHRRDEPRPQAARSRTAGSARTSTTGSRSSRSRCRRCASGARTSRCSSRHFIEKYDQRLGKKVEGIEDDALAAAPRLRLARQHPRAREPDGAVGAVRGRAAHPGERAPRLAPRARRRSRRCPSRRWARSARSPRRAAPR